MHKNYLIFILSVVLFLVFGLFFPVQAEEKRLILATTTSVDNSGLLEVLLPPFEEKFRVRVDVIAVGTGKAITLAKNGDVDVILVHDREAEEEFVKKGYGINRREVMYNDFIILGPAADPAAIKGMPDVREAFKRIAASKSLFISRGDDSGTHKKEQSIWRSANITPRGTWYMETGQGMGACLNIASEKQAYILTDRGTYLAFKSQLALKVLLEGDPVLFNPYGIIPVNPAYHNHVNYQMAMALVDYLVSPQGQKIICNFTRFDQVLFKPSLKNPHDLKP